MLSNFSLSIIENLIKKIDSGFLSFLPVFLLFFLLFDSLIFNETIKFLLISSKFLIFAFDSCQGLFGLLSFFFFHELLILCKLSFFEYNTFNHSSISFFLLSELFLFISFNLFVFLMNGSMDIHFLLDGLFLFEFSQLSLSFPLNSQHLFLLGTHISFFILFSFFEFLLDS